MSIVVTICLAAACLVTGCKNGPERRAKVSYRVSAKENFIKGKKAFEDEDYLEAEEFFRFVKNKFPYSAYATQSELYLADCEYQRDRLIEAADAYRNFVKLHPKNEKVPYATYRIGLCYYKRIPDEWWFAPPAYELDQKETVRAIREFENYLASFKDDENAGQAREYLEKARRRMAEQVRYIMMFNRQQNNMRGVVWRADQLLANYGQTGLDAEALYYKAEALFALKQPQQANQTIDELLKRFPQDRFAERAREMRRKMAEPPSVPSEGEVP